MSSYFFGFASETSRSLSFCVPRKEKLPPREVEICKRFESFRRGSKIPRSVFARAVGYIPESLANYETARAPIRYDVFAAIHKLFPLSPRWLVTGEGSPLAGGNFDAAPYKGQFDERELLSAVYDRVLSPHFQTVEFEAAEFLFAPSGAKERIAKILDDLADPQRNKLYSRQFKSRLGSFLEDAACRLDTINGHPDPLSPGNDGKRRKRERGLPGWPE